MALTLSMHPFTARVFVGTEVGVGVGVEAERVGLGVGVGMGTELVSEDDL